MENSKENPGKKQLRFHFAHDNMRPGQEEFAQKAYECISNRKPLFVDAPTGSGKTASVLSPALSYAMRHNLKVIFLTSRQTQHDIALETAKMLNGNDEFIGEFKRKAIVADIIGKRHMCALTLPALYGSDFIALCKSLRDNEKCDYYTNTKNNGNMTQGAKQLIRELDVRSISDSKNIRKIASERMMCPYEIAVKRTETADLIIADYNHIFNPKIRETVMAKMRKSLQETIIIADEAHNLPKRAREVINSRLSRFVLSRAITEIEEYCAANGLDESESGLLQTLTKMDTMLGKFSSSFGFEDEIDRKALESVIKKCLSGMDDFDDFIYELEVTAEFTRSHEKPSFCSSIASFMQLWQSDEDGILRMVQRKDDDYAFSLRALDPSGIAGEVVNKCHSFIAVSATLKPIDMFAKLLGAEDYETLEVENPFPEENRIDIILSNATTKYESRNSGTFSEYAKTIEEISARVPGNIIVFFPSYYILDAIHNSLETTNGKKLLIERRSMGNEEKKNLLHAFKQESRNGGSIMFAVVSGSFGEGIDLPGEYLKCVVVAGLPFENPDLETKKLIEYYDKKFKRGWDFGYLYPAFNRIFQNAGRLIRTPSDRGAVIYIDSRYAWTRYRKILEGSSKTLVCSSEAGSPNNYSKVLDHFYSA